MRGDCRHQTVPALRSLALGCSFLLTKHISQLFRNVKGGKNTHNRHRHPKGKGRW